MAEFWGLKFQISIYIFLEEKNILLDMRLFVDFF